MDVDTLFSRIDTAEIFSSGNYMHEGVYVVETKNILVKDGHKGQSFIVEFTILESSNEQHKVGTTGSWIVKFAWKQTFGNITKFVMALLGKNPNDKKLQEDPKLRGEIGQIVRAVCGSDAAKKELGAAYEEGMLYGIPLRLECSQTKTQPKPGKPEGGDFTVYTWSPLPDRTAS